ncbi:MAG: glycosyltransferase [Acidobacteria bacterium]|nr:glycosyltransferase [Acidobacteriota bacterium]
MVSFFSWLDLIALPIVVQGFFSLRDGIRFLELCRLAQLQRGKMTEAELPRVAVFLPCKGVDEGLERTLSVLAELDYPRYELILMVEEPTDPAFPVLSQLCQNYPEMMRLVVAGKANHSGQKVHNLLVGVKQVHPEAEVLAFLDSDVGIGRDWLLELVKPLADPTVAATTGYRWFPLSVGRWPNLLRAAWNGSIATSLGPGKNNFAWGGSMAIRRTDFEQLDIAGHWQGAVSDDYALTQAVRSAGRPIVFTPTCLVPTPGITSFRDLWEFTTRQIIITRVYNPGTWKMASGWYVFYSLVFLSFLGRSLVAGMNGSWILAQFIVVLIYLLSVAKSAQTLAAVKSVLPAGVQAGWLRWAGYCLLGPWVAGLFAANCIRSWFTRTIVWRGIGYELRSKTETRIFHPPAGGSTK